MDPLSIIASIAGIISSSRSAPREMLEIARTISDLTYILSELRQVLQNSAELCSRKLLRRIKSAMRRITRIHNDIYNLMDSIKRFQTFRWSLKRSEVQYKLTLIESHKTAIHLMLNILILARATKKEMQSCDSQVTFTDGPQQKEQESEIPLLRKQTENIAYATCHSLVEVSETQKFETPGPSTDPATDSESENEETSTQLHTLGHTRISEDTGQWLFDLAFRAYTQSQKDPGYQNSEDPLVEDAVIPSTCRPILVIRTPSELQIAIYEVGAIDTLIDILLAEWTQLSEEEIAGEPVVKPATKETEPIHTGTPEERISGLYLKDPIGRKFTFPFHQVKNWEGIQELINLAFENSDDLKSLVRKGYYNLKGPSGGIIPPDRWEDTVKPGMTVTMRMWALEKMPASSRQAPNTTSGGANFNYYSKVKMPGVGRLPVKLTGDGRPASGRSQEEKSKRKSKERGSLGFFDIIANM